MRLAPLLPRFSVEPVRHRGICFRMGLSSATQPVDVDATDSARTSHGGGQIGSPHMRYHTASRRSVCDVAVDITYGEHAAELDTLLQKRRDKAVDKPFFNRMLHASLCRNNYAGIDTLGAMGTVKMHGSLRQARRRSSKRSAPTGVGGHVLEPVWQLATSSIKERRAEFGHSLQGQVGVIRCYCTWANAGTRRKRFLWGPAGPGDAMTDGLRTRANDECATRKS
ncbi:hypothetical protein BN2476_2040002 [Paraburkholderia piptadeniae]|uniref:Uncharacterized protein n=1 Tax=Paraburkholderia piptadeniae TaxID=1701573 RepID=A0A1N7SXC3_9BURK|nr:hypothetical protein BN2476_2040002 [Paraburkholderia piptadeniae]